MTGGSSCDDGNFYPRSPCGERRSNQPVTMRTWKFLSTLSLRRATQAANGLANAPPEISIHALLAESDTRRTYHKDESQEFLSTLSLRRATGILAISLRIVFAEFLSTLSLRRATAFSFALLYSTTISIHALLAESDGVGLSSCFDRIIFLSTLSLRRATTWQRGSRITYVISIHALLAESDIDSSRAASFQHHFYPRSPCGERPGGRHINKTRSKHFYPRSPCGERRL